MNDVIANKLESVTHGNATIAKFDRVNHHWQEKIKKSVLGELDSVYVVFPHTVAVLATVVKTAKQENWKIVPCGSGSKLDWGGLGKEIDLVVSTQKCDRIIEHAVDDLTVTVEAGVRLADLQAKLQQTNQFLPLDPAFPESATIGGILATADTGSLRQRYGGVRDLVLGISFVRGDGEIAKAGGRVVKNVAGYDLMKLFIGSYGTLGIISQVTFRTYPIPEASQTLVIRGAADSIKRAIKLLKNSSLTPTAADLITASVAKKLEIAENMALMVRFQTINESIQAQSALLATILENLALEIVTYQGEAERVLWHQLVNLVRVPQSSAAIICKLGLLPTAGVEFLQKLAEIEIDAYSILHVGSGIGILQLTVSELAGIQKLREFCQSNSGFLTVLTAPQDIKQNLDLWGYSGNSLEMMATIRQKFDPQQIFNCDRFIV